MPRFAALAVALGLCAAQTPQSFEVVSIKLSAPNDRMGNFPIPGTITISNRTLREILIQTSRVQPYQVEGGPAWINSEHYNIVAKASTPANFGQMMAMIVPVLEDRFQLKTHRETRESRQFALVVAKGGPKMKLATEQGKSWAGLPNGLIAYRLSMRELAYILAGAVNCPVADETGLDGEYQFALSYSESPTPLAPGEAADPEKAPVTVAVQQLGLKLEARKGPLEVIVIDHVEKPTLN